MYEWKYSLYSANLSNTALRMIPPKEKPKNDIFSSLFISFWYLICLIHSLATISPSSITPWSLMSSMLSRATISAVGHRSQITLLTLSKSSAVDMYPCSRKIKWCLLGFFSRSKLESDSSTKSWFELTTERNFFAWAHKLLTFFRIFRIYQFHSVLKFKILLEKYRWIVFDEF